MSASSAAVDYIATHGGEIMLFGVRVVVDSMRKSVSMNNLSQYEQPNADNNNNNNTDNNNNKNKSKEDGYASADDALPNTARTTSRERKRGVPWTEEEHKLFLLGLQKVGKGDWRGISRNFVKTRTPTQVASHAQKYFLRRSNLSRRRRRSSLFDITTDTVGATPMEEEIHRQVNASQSHTLPPPPPPPETYSFGGFPMGSAYPMTIGPTIMPVPIENPMEDLTLGHSDDSSNHIGSSGLVRPMPVLGAPEGKMISDLNLSLNSTMDSQPIALKLSLPSDESQSSRHSAFQAMPSYSNGDSVISVA